MYTQTTIISTSNKTYRLIQCKNQKEEMELKITQSFSLR